jgi:hypothetical protein
MTRKEFIESLEKGGITFSYSEEGERIVVGSGDEYYIDLGDPWITSLPPNVTFRNVGSLNLGEVAQLPEGVVFDNGGAIFAEEVTRIPRGTKFGKRVKSVLIKSGTIHFHNIDGINYGDLLTATFKYL